LDGDAETEALIELLSALAPSTPLAAYSRR
jgi:hypothetical protein